MSSALRTFGWGIFCACSWTWCIGMFLPVILLERYGWAGFLVFAAPNVIGCVAFGYVVRKGTKGEGTEGLEPFRVERSGGVRTSRPRESSRAERPLSPVRYVCTESALSDAVHQSLIPHHSAIRWFSITTLAYHVFFLGFVAWAIAPVGLEHALRLAIVAPLALLGISALLGRLPERAWLPFAAITYAVSLGVFASIGTAPLTDIALAREGTVTGVDGMLWLVPAIAFGFLLCPYLDATFHRALRSSPSRHAFAIFGVTFTVMIVLTATYWDALTTGLSWIVLAHLTAQSIFTMAAHQRELRADESRSHRASTAAGSLRDPGGAAAHRGRASTGRRTARLAALFAPALALPLAFVGDGVEMYLRFLVFYGLLFPAYVLLFMSPLQVAQPRPRAMIAFAIVLLALAPFYEAAFIGAWTWLAIVPPAAILVWALAAGRMARSKPPQ